MTQEMTQDRVRKQNNKTLKMVQTAVLAAIIILMAYTPIGYLKTGVVEISFLAIPVVIGAIVIGPAEGAILGAIFGLTSFSQCFGMSPFGAALLAINPFLTFVICLVPRILIGLFSGLLFKALSSPKKERIYAYALSSFGGSITNTLFFVGLLYLFFGRTEYIHTFGKNFLAFIGAMITIQALFEAIACMLIGTAVAKALNKFFKK